MHLLQVLKIQERGVMNFEVRPLLRKKEFFDFENFLSKLDFAKIGIASKMSLCLDILTYSRALWHWQPILL